MIRFSWIAVLGLVASGQAATYHVPTDYALIQEAIDASVDGDEVRVAPGTYRENIAFGGRNIAVTGTTPNSPELIAATIIHGNSSGSVVRFDGGEGAEAVLRGFTLIGGSGTEIGSEGRVAGGGIFIRGSSPTLRDLVVRHNDCMGATPGSGHGGGDGGAIYISDGAAPDIRRCAFAYNSVAGAGGAVAVFASTPTLFKCQFIYNSATWRGGGIYAVDGAEPVLIDCVFKDNYAETGGAAYCNATSPSFKRCTFDANRAVGSGGGIYCYDGASPTFLHCIVRDNIAGVSGGGFRCQKAASPTLTNCIVTGNSSQAGGGMRAGNTATIGSISSSPIITNCVFVDNESTVMAGGGIRFDDTAAPILTNLVIWDNAPDGINSGAGVPDVNYSIVQGGWVGESNNSNDPRFISYSGFDYLLHPSSPGIDAGDPDMKDGRYESDGRWPGTYPVGPRADMGAYGGPANFKWLTGYRP